MSEIVMLGIVVLISLAAVAIIMGLVPVVGELAAVLTGLAAACLLGWFLPDIEDRLFP